MLQLCDREGRWEVIVGFGSDRQVLRNKGFIFIIDLM